MSRSRWLLLIAGIGITIFALSFVNAWITHDRELRGEGYRWAQHGLSAWRGVGMPVLTIAAITSLVVAVWALTVRRRPDLPTWPLVVGAAVVFGLVLSAAVPVAQDTHASSVDLSPGILWPVGALLAFGLILGVVRLAGGGRRLVTGLALGVALLALAGWGARWAGLQAAEGTGRHWTEGSYTRAATDGEPAETLTISDGTFSISDRWAGTWDWSGWTVIITDDPACPDARGTYHAHDAGNEALRFVKVVDTCRGDERGADLQTGTWERDG